MFGETLRKWMAGGVLALGLMMPAGVTRAADHGDAPNVAHDQAADIADVYCFLDPNDNTRLVLAVTIRGFIIPAEQLNYGVFDPYLQYHFIINNTLDARPDATIDVRFTERGAVGTPQTATVTIKGLGGSKKGLTFKAPTTPATIAPTPLPRTVTTDPATNIQFFAGVVDDPFIFDIPGNSRFFASANAGARNDALFNRGRDAFAGYNILGIAFSMPLSFVKRDEDVIGFGFEAQRQTQTMDANGRVKVSGKFKTIDKMSNPAVNVVLVPFARKSAYNNATVMEQAGGRFVPDFLSVLAPLNTDQESIMMLLNAAVVEGDYLKLDTRIPNTGPGSGTNPAAAFPNGRRFGDDVVDILLTIINNRVDFGDNVDNLDVPLENTFPYFGLSQQPREPGVIDDNTRG